ncbi:hypothetical protein EK904_002607 [Melospiza melodia maxima]|nr:hypothetical protein EK904_002607 [Melospiza melodia maxima]
MPFRDFNERCAQCSEVNWGLTDGGRFYCRSCHNVTENIQKNSGHYTGGSGQKDVVVCESSTDVDSDPERPSLLHLLSLSESEGDLQTDCSFASSVSKVSGLIANSTEYSTEIMLEKPIKLLNY